MADSCKPCDDVHAFGEDDCESCEIVNPEGEFVLSATELSLFDSVADELVNIAGTEVLYYSLDIEGSVRDPLYDEPIERAWKGPFKLVGHVEYPNGIPEAREEGFRVTFESSVWISRKAVEEAGMPAPREGDIVQFWDTPFQNLVGSHYDSSDPKSGFYFDVTEVDGEGNLFDTPSFVGFKIQVRRRTEFSPERRIVPP